MRVSLLLAPAGLIALSLARPLAAQRSDADWLDQCRDRYHHDQAESCEVRHLSVVRGSGPVDVSPGENGGVEVRGWDRDSIAATARVQAGAYTQEEADEMGKGVTVSVTGSTIRVDGPEGHRHGGWGVEIVLYVPRHTDVVARTHNGPIAVAGVSGKMDLTTANGPIDLDDVTGDVRARSENGPVEVALRGTAWDGAGLDAETINGPVELSIPRTYSADLETGTVNGPWDLRMPLTVTLMGRVPRHITTKLGSGGAPIRVVTTNGPVTVEPAE